MTFWSFFSTLTLLICVASSIEAVLGGAGSVGEPDDREQVQKLGLSVADGAVVGLCGLDTEDQRQHQYLSHFF